VANSAPAGRIGDQPADDPGTAAGSLSAAGVNPRAAGEERGAAGEEPGAAGVNPGAAGEAPGTIGEAPGTAAVNPGAAGEALGTIAGAPGAADEDPETAGLVAAAVAELYDADPQEFTDRRKALAAAARAAGNAAAAKQIAALRKPTRAAWVVNRLARTDPGAPIRLASLAAALQAAQQAKDGPRLRELSAARGPLIDTLAGQALDAAGVPDPSAGLREEVTATLTAALADPDVAAEFASGTLTRAVQWAGFGVAPFGGAADDSEPADALAAGEPLPAQGGTRGDWSPDAAGRRGAGPRGLAEPTGTPRPAPVPPARQRRDASRRSSASATARSAPADEQALAAEAEKRAAQRRENIADAERTVATEEAAAKDAVAAEDRLEAEVRDLEQHLTQARSDLATARLRARRAEAAERRARQTLDRLLRP
jgi:hypothetical protein